MDQLHRQQGITAAFRMCRSNWAVVLLLVSLLCCHSSNAVELTFELPDNARECFHQEIQKGIESTIEFQVVTGGHYDVDIVVEGPNRQVLFNEQKKQYDSFTFKAETTGVYTACFSNEFSTFSHKLVYLDWQVGPEEPLPGLGDHLTALTQMESSMQMIHEALNKITDYQTHHRLREAQGRKRAEDLNERVFIWSVGETCAILCIAFGQVWMLKNFFSEKKPSQYGYSS